MTADSPLQTILVSKLSYGLQWPGDCTVKMSFPPITCYTSDTLMEFGEPDRGDVIVFRYPQDEDKDFIKRVIGLPGETLAAIHHLIPWSSGITTAARIKTMRSFGLKRRPPCDARARRSLGSFPGGFQRRFGGAILAPSPAGGSCRPL